MTEIYSQILKTHWYADYFPNTGRLAYFSKMHNMYSSVTAVVSLYNYKNSLRYTGSWDVDILENWGLRSRKVWRHFFDDFNLFPIKKQLLEHI